MRLFKTFWRILNLGTISPHFSFLTLQCKITGGHVGRESRELGEPAECCVSSRNLESSAMNGPGRCCDEAASWMFAIGLFSCAKLHYEDGGAPLDNNVSKCTRVRVRGKVIVIEGKVT